MASKLEKVLVTGDVDGRFNQLFKRVATVNKKNGPFSFLLCVGNFFGPDNSQWAAYKAGAEKVPLTTYVLGPHGPDQVSSYPDLKGCELCENVIYLGPRGIYPCNSGLKIMYLSGIEAADGKKNDFSFNDYDIKALEQVTGSKTVIDILITGQWPKAISNFAIKPDGCNPDASGSALISRLAYKIKPRYHFSGLEGVHYERIPYRNHRVLIEPTRQVTRFIALGKVGNAEKKKWLYAFNITPSTHCSEAEVNTQPPDVTECPYSDDNTPKLSEQVASKTPAAQFFYNMTPNQGDDGRGKKRRDHDGGDRNRDHDGADRKRMPPPKPTGPCWFCLASPEVEKHLVVSVGEHVYLALAKGGLVAEHMLILPITHFQSTADLDGDIRQEVEKFKNALKKMFKKKGRSVVFFERNYRTQHMQVQVVPIPSEAMGDAKEAFMEVASENGIELDEIPKLSDIAQIAPSGTPFFYVELPTGEKLYHRVKKNFPLQFGRESLASPLLLNMPERIDWKECKISQGEETELRNKIRTAFQAYDFTLEDDDDD